jgi:hypothetical protein
MKNDFLMKINARIKKLEVMTYLRGHRIRIFVEVEAERSPDVG